MVLLIGGWIIFGNTARSRELSPAEQSALKLKDERLTLGDAGAPVRIIEIVDLLCPYCAKANEQIVSRIIKDYVDSGKVQLEIRPVGIITPDSPRAAHGAYCAAESDKFWDYMNASYRDTQTEYDKGVSARDITYFSEDGIAAYVKRAGIFNDDEFAKWEVCMADDTYSATLEQNRQDMQVLGASGTPHFSINGKNINGAVSYPIIQATINATLSENEAT